MSALARVDDMLNSIADALEALNDLPKSREAALVRTKLDEAIMWGHRVAIGLHEPQDEAAPAKMFASPDATIIGVDLGTDERTAITQHGPGNVVQVSEAQARALRPLIEAAQVLLDDAGGGP